MFPMLTYGGEQLTLYIQSYNCALSTALIIICIYVQGYSYSTVYAGGSVSNNRILVLDIITHLACTVL